MKIKSDLLKNVAIRCKNQAENDAAIRVMSMLIDKPIDEGLLPSGNSYTFDRKFPLAAVSEDLEEPTFLRSGYRKHVYPFSEIHKLLIDVQESEIEVKLNNKYTALVSKKGIQVGCQLFPLSIVSDLAEAVKNSHKK
jgi:hypothetical protein